MTFKYLGHDQMVKLRICMPKSQIFSNMLILTVSKVQSDARAKALNNN